MIKNESSAKRKAYQLFREDDALAYEGAVLRCIVTDEIHSVDLHHLDEHGGQDANSWFFENLVPVSSSINQKIQKSRIGSVGLFHEITSLSLAGRATAYFARAMLIRAYACARLAGFLALNHERDPDQSICLAAFAIRALRGVATQWGVPLAVDTLHRSVIPILAMDSVSPRACFHLALGLGAYHCNYGDYDWAAGYYRIAKSFSTLCGEYHRNSEEFGFLISHWRSLLVSTYRLEDALIIRDYLLSRSGYLGTSHGKANDLLWTLRAKSSTFINPEEILENIAKFESTILLSGSLRDWPPKLVNNSGLTAWTHAGYLSLIAEAEYRMGALTDAVDAVATTAKLLRHYRLSPSFFAGKLPVYLEVAKTRKHDLAFSFDLQTPEDLLRRHHRNVLYPPLSFREASRKIMELLLTYRK
jgi:hypothetical protein